MSDLERITRFPIHNLEIFACALKCYREVKAGRKRNVTQFASELGVSKDTFGRRLAEFESHFGAGITKRVTTETDNLFDRIIRLLGEVEAIITTEPRTLRIRLGAGMSMCSHLIPEVLRSFRATDVGRNVDVDVNHGMPLTLRDQGAKGDYDLVLAWCPDTLKAGDHDVVDSVDLQMHLICPRDHAIIEGAFDWERLAGQTIVLLSESLERYPMPKYPMEKLPSGVRLMRVRSYDTAHYMVMGGGEMMTFSMPHLFNNEEKKLLETIRVPELGTVRLSVLRPTRSRVRRSESENGVIDVLAKLFVDHLKTLESTFQRNDLSAVRGTWQICHTGGVGRDKYAWLRGNMNTFRFSDDGYVKGEHVLHPPSGDSAGAFRRESMSYSVFGRLVENTSNVCHLVWSASARDSTVTMEDYAASFIFEKKLLATGPLVGVWTGRQTWANNDQDFLPSTGFMILMKTNEHMSDTKLNDIVETFKYRHLLKLQTSKHIM